MISQILLVVVCFGVPGCLSRRRMVVELVPRNNTIRVQARPGRLEL
jgi:hypothetical protein